MGYKRYERYKDSGVDWIGEVPEGWEVSRIKCLPRNEYRSFVDGDWIESPYITENGIRLIQTGNIGIGKYREQGYRYISEETFYKLNCTEIYPNDVLVCRLAEPVGRACLAPKLNEKMITSVDVCILRPKRCYDRRYIVYFLSFKGYLEEVSIVARGSTRQRISRTQLGNVECLVPPLTEQISISNFLDQKTAEIDSLIANKEKMIQLLQEMRQAIISEAITKGLYKNVKMKDSGVEWIGEIPAHWRLYKITWIFNLISSGTTPSSINLEYYDGSIPWVNTGDLNDGYIYDTPKKVTEIALKECSALKLFPVNTLLIAMYGATIGKLGITKIVATTNQACCALVGHNNAIIKYIFYWFLANRNNIISMAYGGGQPNISQNLIKSLRVPLPEIEEQITIANFLDQKTSKIESLISYIQTQITKLHEYRQSLISEAVTGKIDVRDIGQSTEGGVQNDCNAG